MLSLAIVGAGMAGLAAARRLHDAGMRCTVFEKSRGLGGRMATRRVNGLQFDHGAQYFTARGQRFGAQVTEWCSAGVAASWLPGTFVGTPGMTAPARALAEGLRVLHGCQITRLHGKPGRWTLHSDEAHLGVLDGEVFDAVVLAIPAPQAIPLAASGGLTFPELDRVRYAPCLTLMLAFDAPTALRQASLTLQEGPIAWIARNDTKPGRPGTGETVVVHAAPAWSREHLDRSVEVAAEALLAAARRHIGKLDPIFRASHRWLYARVEQTAGAPFLWDPITRIGACGDWAGGPRVEAAFDSGEALANAITSTEY